jgi:hypothetical protein
VQVELSLGLNVGGLNVKKSSGPANYMISDVLYLPVQNPVVKVVPVHLHQILYLPVQDPEVEVVPVHLHHLLYLPVQDPEVEVVPVHLHHLLYCTYLDRIM